MLREHNGFVITQHLNPKEISKHTKTFGAELTLEISLGMINLLLIIIYKNDIVHIKNHNKYTFPYLFCQQQIIYMRSMKTKRGHYF